MAFEPEKPLYNWNQNNTITNIYKTQDSKKEEKIEENE